VLNNEGYYIAQTDTLLQDIRNYPDQKQDLHQTAVYIQAWDKQQYIE
jgi:hypothetical protein